MTNISIKEKSWEKGLNSRLEFRIEGVDSTIVNSIRRVVFSLIPIYAFNKFDITTNTSIFNNNYLKLRLSNLPVIGITTDTPIYIKKETVVVEQDSIMDDISMNTDEQLNSSSLKQLTMYLTKTNNTTEIMTVGTDDCKFYYMEKQIDSPYMPPYCGNIPIIKLQPKQEIKLSAITKLGIENENAIFSPASICSFNMINDNTYDVALESRGQLDEVTILNYAYENIINLFDKLMDIMPDDNNINGKISIKDSDHTIGALIASGLQNHKKVKFGGYNMPHLLDNTILVHYELVEALNIKDILQEIVDKYKKIFNTINNLIKKIK